MKPWEMEFFIKRGQKGHYILHRATKKMVVNRLYFRSWQAAAEYADKNWQRWASEIFEKEVFGSK